MKSFALFVALVFIGGVIFKSTMTIWLGFGLVVISSLGLFLALIIKIINVFFDAREKKKVARRMISP